MLPCKEIALFFIHPRYLQKIIYSYNQVLIIIKFHFSFFLLLLIKSLCNIMNLRIIVTYKKHFFQIIFKFFINCCDSTVKSILSLHHINNMANTVYPKTFLSLKFLKMLSFQQYRSSLVKLLKIFQDINFYPSLAITTTGSVSVFPFISFLKYSVCLQLSQKWIKYFIFCLS
jgi:hypothetical protein